ncbi:MFS transporter [Bifidobacterium simiarum]|uniref:MFS transporter n=1 Tax=Bifidobacterium simiarum TaxID=2045441 RepID=UPI001BDBDCF6|nr:MFS transporter [Bifidobacterium simiarum]MBT1166504.1 MFS transporter [Bifidobacterium simiarum]
MSTSANPSVWRASETDEHQKKAPYRIGIALLLGAALYGGPYTGSNIVLLPAKTAELAPDSKAAIIAVMSTSAMVVAALSNILFGALSDLTRSRWGRRAPWVICGSIGTAIMLNVVAHAPTVPFLIVSWCVYQVFLNVIIAPFLGIIADRVAPKYRGTITSMFAFGSTVGSYAGQVLAAQFITTIPRGFFMLSVLTFCCGFVVAFLTREPSSLPMPKAKFDKRMVLDHFSLPMHNCRDYYLALFGKFMITSAKYAIAGYQLYILTDYMKQDDAGASHYVTIISLCMMFTAMIITVITGIVTDRIHSRKIPVALASFCIAVGSFIPFFSAEPWTMVAYGLFAGTGLGAFNAVDQALNIEVLPNPETAAKDLGVLNLSNTGGQVLGPVLAATFISAVGYHALFPVAGVCALVGMTLVMMIKSVK